MKAYHFCGPTLRDGRPIPPDGEWLIHEGEAVMCEAGLHASRHPFDALQYAPGPILCLVECEDVVSEQDDKLVCRRRKIVRRIDATELLRAAARQFALYVIHLWDAPAVVREFLETGDESLRAAARNAARNAAKDAWDAWAASAARAAARDAAWAASAAWTASAAKDAWDAWAASAASAAWAASAASAAQRDLFEKLVTEAFREIDQ